MTEQVGAFHGGTLVAGVKVRVLKSEEHSLASTVARYGLESGATLADHVILNPNAVTISFEMPNSNKGLEWARDVYQQFVKMRDNRTVVSLETEHGRYKNMVIAAFTPFHKAPYKGALVATVRLEQVGFAGGANMVSAAGGRPQEILEQDGTQCTACEAVNSGTQSAVAKGAVMDQCMDCLEKAGA